METGAPARSAQQATVLVTLPRWGHGRQVSTAGQDGEKIGPDRRRLHGLTDTFVPDERAVRFFDTEEAAGSNPVVPTN